MTNWNDQYFSKVTSGIYKPANIVDYFNKFYKNYPNVQKPPVLLGPPLLVLGLIILSAFIFSASQDNYNSGLNIIFALGLFATLIPGFFVSWVYPIIFIRFKIARKRLTKMKDCSHNFIIEDGRDQCSNCKFIDFT